MPSSATFTSTLTGNNMDNLDLSVELVTNDNSGESKLYISIDDSAMSGDYFTKDVFARLVPAKGYSLVIFKLVNGSP